MTAISVVIPTCGRPTSLACALGSVYEQSVLPQEVVVVDDTRGAQQEATAAVVARFQSRGARLIGNDRVKGPSGARNCGVRHARGEMIAFLDDDDEWLPRYLGEVLRCIEANGADVVCTDLMYRYDDGSERAGKSAPEVLALNGFLIRNPGLIGSNLVIRRTLCQAIGGFDESLPTYEDVDFGIRLSLQPGVRYTPLRQRLVRYYQHTRSRLCMRLGEPMSIGVRRYYELHGSRMSEAEREQFCDLVRTLWGVDEYGRDAGPVAAPAAAVVA